MDVMKKTQTKLLSPAGGPEAGYAAFFYGADAIYCGLQSFSARAEAVNFSPEELRSIVHYAHSLEKRREVFVTVNTLLSESEIPEMADAILTIAEAGADALIVQDMGVARLAREIAPTLALHASTQMAIHNLEGARAATNWGFSQVTLARELTIDEVRRIAGEGIHTEVFIHGALCYSYSGLCLMSAVRNGRSGNRGRCGYPCRDRYAVSGSDTNGLAFSMKDLALSTDVSKLADAGVSCLKIEGRMKSPLYVAAVTDFYRRILDGTLTRESDLVKAQNDLKTIFSRKWTKFHSDGVHHDGGIDPDITGHRGVPIGIVDSIRSFPDGTRWLRFRTDRRLELHDGIQVDLPGQDRPYGFPIDKLDTFGQSRGIVFECQAGNSISILLPEDSPHIPTGVTVYCASSQEVKKRFASEMPLAAERKPRMPIAITVAIRADHVLLKADLASDPTVTAESVMSDTYTVAKNPEKAKQGITESCGKLGESEFSLHSLTVDNPDSLFVPMSQLNELRRRVCVDLSASLVVASTHRHDTVAAVVASRPCHVKPESPIRERWVIKTDQPACLDEINDFDEVILDLTSVSDAEIEQCTKRYGAERIRLAIPLIIRAWESTPLHERISQLVKTGCTRWMVSNPGAFEFIPATCDIQADWTLSVWNSEAIAEWIDKGACGVTLSPESTEADIVGLLAEWGDVATVILYQDTPLMISETCPLSSLGAGCGTCPPKLGNDEPTRLHPLRGGDDVLVTMQRCRTFITNEHPTDISKRLDVLRDSGACLWRLDFCLRPYSATDASQIWNRIRTGCL